MALRGIPRNARTTFSTEASAVMVLVTGWGLRPVDRVGQAI